MSSTAQSWEQRIEAAWGRAAARHACRAPLWSDPGAPPHLFIGRPIDARESAGGGAAARPREAERLTARAFGGLRAATLRQEHGARVHRVGGGRGRSEPIGDGLSTDEAGLALGIRTADCAPILLADRRRGAVAALHAGWRGTAAGIVARALEHLAAEYGSEPADLDAVIGPAVGGCCYEVGEDVRAALEAGPLARLAEILPGPEGRFRIDLARLNAAALAAAGVRPARIQILAACTRCANDRLHSYRAEGAGVGRNWSFIATPRLR